VPYGGRMVPRLRLVVSTAVLLHAMWVLVCYIDCAVRRRRGKATLRTINNLQFKFIL
jgi:hypothetical protein